MIAAQAVSKAWHTLNPHLPQHVDLGENTRASAWSKTDSPIQARLVCSADEVWAVFEVQLRVDLSEIAAHKLKLDVHVVHNDTWLATHKAGNGHFAPAPEVKALPEQLVRPFQIPVLINMESAQSVQVSISAETEAANYWANIARFTFFFGAEARKSHLVWEPLAVMRERNANNPENESIFAASRLKKGIKKFLGAPPGAGLGAKHAPDPHSVAVQDGPPAYYTSNSYGAPPMDRRDSYWSEHTANTAHD
ncbi:hypothetical protein CF319_g4256 [Tilletia indica]|uniref:Uncharacterized protein n=1 Tax=Tilletia indica TaxID=43049 RepID=A0A177TI19_9BASI|nr:hypothetical protein CF319_g4256 [Tilletia indica]KAE8229630.1 hypothetical protein CF326_g5397 [Tilletia indica]KAE8257312.1 hypothetical protein A4X13_0g2442 [Tilletia indica]